MQVGALDYILKPFRLREVMPVLSRALDCNGSGREPDAPERERRRSEELAAAYPELEVLLLLHFH